MLWFRMPCDDDEGGGGADTFGTLPERLPDRPPMTLERFPPSSISNDMAGLHHSQDAAAREEWPMLARLKVVGSWQRDAEQ